MEGNRGGHGGVDRRGFVKTVGLGVGGLATLGGAKDAPAAVPAPPEDVARLLADADWPSLMHYDAAHLARIALPLGGIGTGTVSLGGRGDLRDLELMNRPGQGLRAGRGGGAVPRRCVSREAGRPPVVPACSRARSPADELRGQPRLARRRTPACRASATAAFATAYPFGRVVLTDPDVPARGAPQGHATRSCPRTRRRAACRSRSFRVELRNRSARPVEAAVCASLPELRRHGRLEDEEGLEGRPAGPRGRRGTATPSGARAAAQGRVPHVGRRWTRRTRRGARSRSSRRRTAWSRARTAWAAGGWSGALLDFWDDFLGRRAPRRARGRATDSADGLARGLDRSRSAARRARSSSSSPGTSPTATRGRPKSDPPRADDWVGNHYTTQFADAWDVAEKTLPRLADLHRRTRAFVLRVRGSDLPAEVKEAALFNLSTLRTPDLLPHRRRPLLRLGGLRGHRRLLPRLVHARLELRAGDAVPVRRSRLRRCARSSSAHATDDAGLMSFRVDLPIGAGAGVRQGRRRRADGLRHEDVPRLAALRRRRRSCARCGRRSARPSSSAGSPAAGTPTATA